MRGWCTGDRDRDLATDGRPDTMVIVYSNTRCFRAAPGLSFFEYIFARTIGLDNLVQRLFLLVARSESGPPSFLFRNSLEIAMTCVAPRIVFDLQGSTTTQGSHLGNKIEVESFRRLHVRGEASPHVVYRAGSNCLSSTIIVTTDRIPFLTYYYRAGPAGNFERKASKSRGKEHNLLYMQAENIPSVLLQ